MFNFSTPEEKTLIKNSASVFAQAHEFAHEGIAGNTPVWSWPQPAGGEHQRPAVLLLHGWGGEAGLMGAFVGPLLDLGYRVLIPDLPGQGKAQGRLVDTRVSAATIVEVHNRFGPFHAIIGHSLGGLLGCMAAAGHEVIGGKVDVAKLVTINSPVSLGSVINGLGGAIGLTPTIIDQVAVKTEQDLRLPLAKVHAQVMLEQADLPALAFHDTDDPFIPHAGSLARLAQHEKLQTRQTSGLGHISVLEDETVIAQVADFLGHAG